MAEPDLIDGYRAVLRRRLPRTSNMDDLLDEVEDHLRSTVEHLTRSGVDVPTAQRMTLERFGEPLVVARAYATTPTGGLRMPTRFTRAAGFVAIAAALGWLAVGAFAVFGPTSLLGEFSELQYAVWAAMILFTAMATIIAVLGLLRRAGAARSGSAWVAVPVLVACVFLLAAFAWFWPAGGALLTLGCLIAVLQARAAGLPTGVSIWLMVLAFPAGTGLFFALHSLEVGPVDEYGDRPLAFVLGIMLAAALFAVALARLGRWLAREVPLDRPDRAIIA